MKLPPLRFLGLVWIATVSPLCLLAEENLTKIGVNTTLAVPSGWKIIESHQDTAPENVTSSTDLNAMTLLLAARPNDPARKASISIFRVNFRSMGSAPRMMGNPFMMGPSRMTGNPAMPANPPPVPEDTGAQIEAEKLLYTVMSQGFAPTALQTSRASLRGGSFLTIEITAKNAEDEERVFTDTIGGAGSCTIHFFSSRQSGDTVSAQEIAGTVRSLSVGEKPATSGTAATSENNSVEVSPQSAQIVADNTDSLLMVEGVHGVGSGFLCKIEGHPCVITNAHVICDNPGFKITSLKNAHLTVNAGVIAVGHDIVRLDIPSAEKSFSVMENLDMNVKIGDPIVVLGNAQGAMVVKPIEGKVVGVGPNLVEVDAPFVPGNSGSPIIHRATGKVIGVATYALERKINKSGYSVTIETRRFGYRLDSVKKWEPINWQTFYAQAALVDKIDTLSNDFIKLYSNSRSGCFEASNYKTPAMQRAIQSFTAHTQQRRSMGDGEKNMLVGQFISELRTVSRSDVYGFDLRTAYDYFRGKVEEQIKFRDEIYNDLTYTIQAKGL